MGITYSPNAFSSEKRWVLEKQMLDASKQNVLID